MASETYQVTDISISDPAVNALFQKHEAAELVFSLYQQGAFNADKTSLILRNMGFIVFRKLDGSIDDYKLLLP